MATQPVEVAERLIAQGQSRQATVLLKRAADHDDVDALFRLAVANLVGDIVPRDLTAARAFLRRAVTIGHVDAALMEIALVANGSGGMADWPRALALLSAAAANDPVAAEHAALIHAMRLDGDGRPVDLPTARVLSVSPDVRLFAGLLTPDECLHLARTAAPMFEPAMVVDPATGRVVPHPVRTSEGAVIGPAREDLVVRAINLRLAAASGTDPACGEALTVLRYNPGQEYRPHHDAIAGLANQRAWTMLVYLNDGFSGGETRFVPGGLTIDPKRGDTVLFRNLLPDGRPDPAAGHAGLPVRAGHKWLATRWIRREPIDLWNLSR